ncbi:hypothetical protein [Nocardiopsis sp. NRRL B-16309]|uniref:hypothetical protein n=1 Tax=Nocardiopsis sp. NRRL B-16309 TaxID=1519494 RepID=UPI0006ADFB76|nr:hypothetical protein [Nocardiopsis sp. NRRL B-16309]
MYATDVQLAAWLGLDDPPANATRALRDASLDVDTLLVGAVYDVDEDDQPTDADVALALQEATCAQAAWNPSGHSQTAEDAQKTQVKVDKVSVSYAADPSSGRVIRDRYAPAAVDILRVAGLVPAHVVVC